MAQRAAGPLAKHPRGKLPKWGGRVGPLRCLHEKHKNANQAQTAAGTLHPCLTRVLFIACEFNLLYAVLTLQRNLKNDPLGLLSSTALERPTVRAAKDCNRNREYYGCPISKQSQAVAAPNSSCSSHRCRSGHIMPEGATCLSLLILFAGLSLSSVTFIAGFGTATLRVSLFNALDSTVHNGSPDEKLLNARIIGHGEYFGGARSKYRHTAIEKTSPSNCGHVGPNTKAAPKW